MKPVQVYVLYVLLNACMWGTFSDEGELIQEDKDVLVLTDSNFNQALILHSQLLVHFCEYVRTAFTKLCKFVSANDWYVTTECNAL